MAVVANCHRDKKTCPEPYTAAFFMGEAPDKKEMSWESQLDLMMAAYRHQERNKARKQAGNG